MRRLNFILLLLFVAGGCDFFAREIDLPFTTYTNSQFNISINQPEGWAVIDKDNNAEEFRILKRTFPYQKVAAAISIDPLPRKGPTVLILQASDKPTPEILDPEHRHVALMRRKLVTGHEEIVYWLAERMYKAKQGGQEVYSYYTKDLMFNIQISGTEKEIATYKPTLYKMLTSFRH